MNNSENKAGFDSAKGDPLGGVEVTPAGFAYMTQGLRTICPRISVVLEGGYGIESNAASSLAVIRTLLTHPLEAPAIDSLLGELHAPSY